MTTPSALTSPHHVISAAQLEARGYSDQAVRHGVSSKRLFPVHRGVYAIGRPDLSREGAWLAAVLGCAEGAALSHRSAALLWQLLEFGDGHAHVLVPMGFSGRGPRGVRLHRSRTLVEDDVQVENDIPVTGVVRTLRDLAIGRLSDAPLEGAVLNAQRRHGIELAELVPNARLRRIVARYDPLAAMTDSDLEIAFLKLCRRHKLPLPELQEPFGPYFADFTWYEYRLIVETDGRGAHDNPERFRKDRVRDRYLKARGFEVLRFTYAEIVYEGAKVAAELRAAFARRARELAA